VLCCLHRLHGLEPATERGITQSGRDAYGFIPRRSSNGLAVNNNNNNNNNSNESSDIIESDRQDTTLDDDIDELDDINAAFTGSFVCCLLRVRVARFESRALIAFVCRHCG
jgi:hypothetical protein